MTKMKTCDICLGPLTGVRPDSNRYRARVCLSDACHDAYMGAKWERTTRRIEADIERVLALPGVRDLPEAQGLIACSDRAAD